MDSDGENVHLANFMDEVLEYSEVCRSFDKAPHVPITGTRTVAGFNENIR